jgi:hypothetical protein
MKPQSLPHTCGMSHGLLCEKNKRFTKAIYQAMCFPHIKGH